MKRAQFLIPGLLLAFGLSLQTTAAQSPPLGPATFRSEDHQIPVGLLTNIVRSKVQEVVDNANVMIKSQTSLADAKLKNVKVYPPFRAATDYKDRPNQYYIDVPMNIEVDIDITAAADRQIYFPLDLKISCDGWQTEKGTILIVAQPGPPSIEGGSIIEDILHVRDYIDSKIRQNVSQPGAISILLPSPCETLGVVPRTGNDVTFSYVAFDPPSRRTVISGAFAPTIEVKLLRLKRLEARGNGGIIYNPTENILLSAFADFSYRQANLTMKEDDDVALNIAPIILKPPLYDKFVLIANITQQPSGQPEDSSYDTTSASANYSPGTHTVRITKTYVIPPSQLHTKPTFVQVPAYELTYSLEYSSATKPVGSTIVGARP
ncbi:MAG TPA: hypothetical protein VE961_03715 [Pyrinomonadaceae bacterium]|nr:hypothetical protein [Pyrinomonadaceae bacterium]